MLDISAIINQYPDYAMGIAFALAMVESLPFVGSLIPGMLTMPAIGWLMASNQIPPATTFLLIIIGAMIGDYIGYFMGFYSKNSAHQKAVYYKKEHWLATGKSFVKKYGALSVVIGRFIGPLRSSIPLFAGIFEMNIVPFTLAALPSVCLWAIIHLAPGYMVVWVKFDLLKQSSMWVDGGMFIIATSLVLLSIVVGFCHESPRVKRVLSAVFDRLNMKIKSQQKHTVQIACLTIASITMSCLIYRGSFQELNQLVYTLFSAQNSILLSLSLVHTALCYIPLILLLTVGLGLLLMIREQPRSGLILISSVGCAFALCFMLKYSLHYPRPDHIASYLGNQSLPSGHTCLTTALILSLLPKTKALTRLHMVGYMFIVLTMLSRVLIGAHWVSDVLLGWVIGYLGYVIGEVITEQASTRSAHVIERYSMVAKQYVGHKTQVLSQTTLLLGYCIIAWGYATLTGKMSIIPYLLPS
ncbi:MAG: hypothetical protein CMF43_03150 [Legionellales bacterium]|nr:hypothetical protein [Legionellales bacterium]|tara:strand:- start:6518 stop:7927 length:1410 start_codon:yes stop_codon:yes gene_type:complete